MLIGENGPIHLPGNLDDLAVGGTFFTKIIVNALNSLFEFDPDLKAKAQQIEQKYYFLGYARYCWQRHCGMNGYPISNYNTNMCGMADPYNHLTQDLHQLACEEPCGRDNQPMCNATEPKGCFSGSLCSSDGWCHSDCGTQIGKPCCIVTNGVAGGCGDPANFPGNGSCSVGKCGPGVGAVCNPLPAYPMPYQLPLPVPPSSLTGTPPTSSAPPPTFNGPYAPSYYAPPLPAPPTEPNPMMAPTPAEDGASSSE